MKKKRFLLMSVMSFVLLTVLTGCSSDSDEKNTDDNVSAGDSELAPPEGRQDASGTVLSVTGNEVTIQQVVRPEGAEDGSDENREDMRAQFENMSDEERQAMREEMGGGQGGGMADMTDEERQAVVEERQANMEYEEVEVIIPVGTTIVLSEVEEAEEGEKGKTVYSEASLSDISSDMRITIWKDGEEITYVLISEAGTGGMGGAGGPGMGGMGGGMMGGRPPS